MKYDCLGGMPRPTGQLGVMGSSVSDYVRVLRLTNSDGTVVE